MEDGFAWLMIIFGACIFLYGLLLRITKNPAFLPHAEKVVGGETKEYVDIVGKILIVAALPPLVAAYLWFFGSNYYAAAFVSLVAGFVVVIDFGIRKWINKEDEENAESQDKGDDDGEEKVDI